MHTYTGMKNHEKRSRLFPSFLLTGFCLFGLKKASVEGCLLRTLQSLLVATVFTERDQRQGGFQTDLQSQLALSQSSLL